MKFFKRFKTTSGCFETYDEHPFLLSIIQRFDVTRTRVVRRLRNTKKTWLRTCRWSGLVWQVNRGLGVADEELEHTTVHTTGSYSRVVSMDKTHLQLLYTEPAFWIRTYKNDAPNLLQGRIKTLFTCAHYYN